MNLYRICRRRKAVEENRNYLDPWTVAVRFYIVVCDE